VSVVLYLHGKLKDLGLVLASLGTLLAMLLLFPGVPIIALIICFVIGIAVAQNIGGGAWSLFGVPFVCYLFLAHYVWHPYLGPKVMKAFSLLSESRE